MRSFYKKKKKGGIFYFINYRIQAPIVRVIDEEGKQIGILKKEEALKLAQEKNSDLVLIAPKATPPVTKIINFKKFLYQEGKKQQEAKKNVKKGIVKEIKLSLFIAQADLSRLEEKGKSFLNEGHQLRISLPLKGRERSKKKMAFELINKFIANLGEVNIAKSPQLEGNVIRGVIARKK